ncbi:hypothetical protein NHH82_12250 [Oxalobacteraceae bacterium OTU3REALA1]|nr:hypothetical protein NHH82_12250 [Oxalobacteraceae bacterium OTU3REALA1]
MWLQNEFYLHITKYQAGDATPLLATIALHIGYDSKKYPLSLEEIKKIGRLPASPGSCGQNEFFVIEYLRANMMEGTQPWKEDQIRKLEFLARMHCQQETILQVE